MFFRSVTKPPRRFVLAHGATAKIGCNRDGRHDINRDAARVQHLNGRNEQLSAFMTDNVLNHKLAPSKQTSLE